MNREQQAQNRICGERLDRIVLFGFHARGDAHLGSDYNVAVFPKTLPDRWKETNVRSQAYNLKATAD